MNTVQPKPTRPKHFSGNYQEIFDTFCKNYPAGYNGYTFFASYWSGAYVFNLIHCKESFNVILWNSAYRTKKIIPDFIFNLGKNVNTFISIMNRVHRAWKLPKFTYILSKCGNLIYVKNQFWRQNVAHTEVLSILAKGINLGHIGLSQNDNEIFTVYDNKYFNENTLHLFKVGKEFVKHFYELDRVQDYNQIYSKLFSLGCNGLITSLNQVRRSFPAKFNA